MKKKKNNESSEIIYHKNGNIKTISYYNNGQLHHEYEPAFKKYYEKL